MSQGESGKTLEDFITHFLVYLATIHEVSNDVDDHNALWCLAQYFRILCAEVVPAGRWIRQLGRLRLDAHRTGNEQCTKDVRVATTVQYILLFSSTWCWVPTYLAIN